MNWENLQYETKLYFGEGSNKQELGFVLGMRSSWLWVPTEECPIDMCTNKRLQIEFPEGFDHVANSKTLEQGSMTC